MKDDKSLNSILRNTFWTLRLIFRYNPIIFICIAISQVLTASTPFVRNKLFSQLLDSLVYHQQNQLISIFTLFLFFLILTSFFSFVQNQLTRILDTKLQGQLRTLFIGKVSQLDYQHLESKETGNLISKVDEEFGWRMRQTVQDVSNIFANLISLVTVTIIIFPRYPLLWMLIFLSQIPQYLIERYWVQKDWKLREENSEKSKLMWDLNYQLRTKNYLAELRINNAVDFMFQKFKDIFDFFTNRRVKLRVDQTPSELGLITLSIAVNGICLYVLIQDASNNLLTIGLFTFFFQTIQQTADFFRGLVYSSVSITENSYHIGNFRQIISLKNIILAGNHTVKNPTPPKIEFVNVSFKYPGSNRFVYRNLNLTIDPQEEIAFVGANCAGKSTLIKLICHFYEPTSGEILINGVNLKEVKLDNWYGKLSYLAQEFNLYYNLSLRENVAIGDPNHIDDARVIKSLNKADATFVKHYKKGLDTLMSQRYGGEEPSWGKVRKLPFLGSFIAIAPL